MKLVLIGGGYNGRGGTPYETELFDKQIVKMSGKQSPTLLFVGFAQMTQDLAETCYQTIKHNFEKLGCSCDHLRQTDLKDALLTKRKIMNANIIYVAGGNTLRLMTIFRRYNIDALLKQAANKGTVLSGVSAGAICWCDYGNSDSRKYTSHSTQLIKVTGLGFVHTLFCPHYDTEPARQPSLQKMMKTTKGIALALENCTALCINGNNYRVLKAKDNVNAFRCFWKNKEYIKQNISDTGKLNELIQKNCNINQ